MLIVGNGGENLSPEISEIIDSASFVVRCNQAWKTVGLDGFGKKTSAVCARFYDKNCIRWCAANEFQFWDAGKSKSVDAFESEKGIKLSRGFQAMLIAIEKLSPSSVGFVACDALQAGTKPYSRSNPTWFYSSKRNVGRGKKMPARHDWHLENLWLREVQEKAQTELFFV